MPQRSKQPRVSRPRSLTREVREKAVCRCAWPGADPLMINYHDKEWGVPLHDDRRLFEFMVLDAAQAGLSWKTILYKRESFRSAFDGFDPVKIARYTKRDVQRLMTDRGIIRNRQKIDAAIVNAHRFLDILHEFGAFDRYIWGFVDGRTIKNSFKSPSKIPARTPESEAMSKDLRRRGFKFVGPTICYAFMQAAGMVNDHTVDCFRYRQV